MNAHFKNVLSRAEAWSDQEQEELVQVALAIEARRHGLYHASAEELKAIDEGPAAIERGDIASDEEIEAIFAKYRRI
jgi:hypothetical protein